MAVPWYFKTYHDTERLLIKHGTNTNKSENTVLGPMMRNVPLRSFI